MDITNLVSLIIEVIVTLFILGFVPMLKAKMDVKDALAWVDIAVRAAEQLYRQNEGEKKKAYVLNFLLERNIILDDAEIETAIEAAVLKLHKELMA